MTKLVIENLHVNRNSTEIVHGVSFSIGAGEVHVVLGKNGSGKTSLVNATMGHPVFAVTNGSVRIDDEDVTNMAPHEKARRGLFLSPQQPPEVPGVPLEDLLRTAKTALTGERPKTAAFSAVLSENIAKLRLDPRFAERAVNVGASGGEKKRTEMVQMLALTPKFAILDEPDSGLDADALWYVADAIAELRKQGAGFLIVTHYQQFIDLLMPDAIHVMRDGRVVQSGGMDLLVGGIAGIL